MNLAYAGNFSEATLIKCVRSWPLLEHFAPSDAVGFAPSGFTDAVVLAMCKSCPLIKILNLATCNITDTSIFAIAETYPDLEDIQLDGNYDYHLYATISSDAVKVLVRKCNKLNYIHFGLHSLISDDVLRSAGENCKDLEALSVRDCPLVTAVGFGFIINHCKKLAKVTLDAELPSRDSLEVMYPHIFFTVI